MRTCAARLLPLAERSDLELLIADLPELWIEGDEKLLTRLLRNLCENALKYACPLPLRLDFPGRALL